VAKDRDDYVSKALKLGQDAALRTRVAKGIQANSHKLWNDLQTVYEWAAFLSTVTGRMAPSPEELAWSPVAAVRGLAPAGQPLRYHGQLPRLELRWHVHKRHSSPTCGPMVLSGSDA
jgi:hypothetical protein